MVWYTLSIRISPAEKIGHLMQNPKGKTKISVKEHGDDFDMT
jgi:hypothetical protein